MSRITFAQLGVPEDLNQILLTRGITAPFPIQAASLPDALAGRDVCGRAPTGSGKTLAFGLALAVRTPKAKPKRPTSLVLVPTRELAAQVEREIRPLAKARQRTMTTVYGGTGYGEQRKALRQGVDILVACPGRLEDLLEQRDLVLSDVSIVVVDEADRMADMGFLPAVKRLLDACRSERQTMLFSATLDGDVDVLIRRYQNNPSRHHAETPEEKQGDVRHLFWRAERDERVQLTANLIDAHPSAIVFCRTRHGADRLAKQLSRAGLETAAIHGSRSQPQRDRALAAFTAGRVKALIATDVAARGIHVDDVSCVVHFDPPTTSKDYLHRSGRTGRAGADGTVVSMVGREHIAAVRGIQKDMRLPVRVDEAPKMNGSRVVVVDAPSKIKRSGHPMPRSNGSGPSSSGSRTSNGSRTYGSNGSGRSGHNAGRRQQRNRGPRRPRGSVSRNG